MKKKDKKQKNLASITTKNNDIENVNGRSTNTRDIFRAVDIKETNKRILELGYAKDLGPEDACAEFQARIYATTGSSNQQVALRLLTKAGEALTKSSDSVDETLHLLNTITKAMQALAPQDEIEGQLISQLIVLHEQCMLWIGKAFRTDRVDFANVYLNGASKLLTRHHETLATLLKYRRGGEQHVHVEHVHVHGGAQAIVGSVGTGGGLNSKKKEGPHAKV